MKKIIIILILILSITGCYQYKELNNTYIIKALMIDYKNNEYIITANIIKDNKKNHNIKLKCNNLNDLITKIKEIYYKNIDLNHLDLIILTKNSINYKLKDLLKYFYNSKNVNINASLALTNDENIKLNNQYKKIKAIEKESSETKNISLKNFITDLYKSNKTYIPELENNGIYIINNFKICNKLNKSETIIYNFLTDNIYKSKIANIKIYKNKTYIIKNKNINIFIFSKISNNKNYKKILKKEIINFNNKYKLYNKKLNIIIKGDIYEKY